VQGTTVELVHEMLVTEWPTLVRWLQDSQAMRGFTHEVRQAAKQWAGRERSRDLVWRGAPAQEALVTAERHVLDLSVIEREFLAAVRVEAGRARRRRVAVFATIFSVLGLVIAGGAIAFVRIRAAELHAQEQARTADREAQRARAALDAMEAARQQRSEAVQKSQEAQAIASQATEAETMTKEELTKKNAELDAALTAAREQQKRAEAAAEQAKKASDEAKAAKAQAEALAAKEHAELLKAQAQMKDIDHGDLRK
jgi:hypothetical protein